MNKELENSIRHEFTNCRSKRLRQRITQLIKLLNFFGRDLRVQQMVDHFYYIQKQQELETLEEKLKESIDRAFEYANKLENIYGHVSHRWRVDYVNLKQIITNSQLKQLNREEINN